MLVLTRKIGESIVIDGTITVTVSQLDSGKVRIAIDAPKDVRILRAELLQREKPTKYEASAPGGYVYDEADAMASSR